MTEYVKSDTDVEGSSGSIVQISPSELLRLLTTYEAIDKFNIFGQKTDNLLSTHFNNYSFPNSSIIERSHMCIGSGKNGFVIKVNLFKNEISNSLLLKSTNKGNNDNLIYEYLIGQCTNKFCDYFPIFCRTYGICKYKNGIYRHLIKSHCSEFGDDVLLGSGININSYLENLDVADLEKSIVNGCAYQNDLCLILQYYNAKPIYDILKLRSNLFVASDIPLICQIITTFHFIYEALNKLKDMFTHYDLHTSNVLLYELPNSEYIDIVYHDSDMEYRTKSNYMPCIIDYGHSFINCHLLDDKINNSNEIIDMVCNKNTKNGGPCLGHCGFDSGFFYTNSIRSTENYYISDRMPNRSHDLRLLNLFLFENDLDDIEHESLFLENFCNFLRNVTYKDQYGTPELNTIVTNKINNVEQAAKGLRDIIQMPSFIQENQKVTFKKKYGTLHIWIDQFKNSEFTFE